MTMPTESSKVYKARHYSFCEEVMMNVKLDMKSSFLLHFLCARANHENQSWMSYASIAKLTQMHRKTVMSAAKNLEEKNIITIIRRKDDARKANMTNLFILNFNYTVQCIFSPAAEHEKPKDTIQKQPGPKSGKSDSSEISSPAKAPEGSPRITKVVPERDQAGGRELPKYKPEYTENTQGIENTGGVISEITPEFFDANSYDLQHINVWTIIKGFVFREYQKKLPRLPNEADLEAISWALEKFAIHPESRPDCLRLCDFAIHELGEPTSTLNPVDRLYRAYLAHDDENRFTSQWDKYCSMVEALAS